MILILAALNEKELKLFNEYMDDAKAIVRSFPTASLLDQGELDSLAYKGLYYAAQNWDPKKGTSFGSYLYTVLNSFRFHKEYLPQTRQEEISLETPVHGTDIAIKEILQDLESVKMDNYILYKNAIEEIKERLDDREWDILNMAAEGYKGYEIAQKYGISAVRVHKILEGIRAKLEDIVEGIGI